MDPIRLDCLFCFSCLLFLLTLYALLVFLVIQFFDGQEWSVPLACSHVFILTLVLLTIILRLWKRWDGHQIAGGEKAKMPTKGKKIPRDIRLLGMGMATKSAPAIIRRTDQKQQDALRPFVPTDSMVIRADQQQQKQAPVATEEEPTTTQRLAPSEYDGLVLSVV